MKRSKVFNLQGYVFNNWLMKCISNLMQVFFRLGCVVSILMLPLYVQAQPWNNGGFTFAPSSEFRNSSPVFSATGNYTLQMEGGIPIKMMENGVDIGKPVASSNNMAYSSMSFSNKPSGVYNYVYHSCSFIQYGTCTHSEPYQLTVARTPGVPGAISFSPSHVSCDDPLRLSWGAAAGGNNYHVQERSRQAGGGWSSWYDVAVSHGGLSRPVAVTTSVYSNSEYQYRVRARRGINGYLSGYSGFRYSAVLNRGACSAPRGAGFDGDKIYTVYQGDYNRDNLTDFYIRQDPGINPQDLPVGKAGVSATPPSDIDAFVLQQNIDQRTFKVVKGIGPVNKARMNNWPEQPEMFVVLGDYNSDGFLDAVVKGVRNVFSTADDQLIFYHTDNGQATAMDASFNKFVDEVFQWVRDPQYFDNNAPTATQTLLVRQNVLLANKCSPGSGSEITSIFSSYDEFSSLQSDFIEFCHGRGSFDIVYEYRTISYYIQVGVKDYRQFDQQALLLTRMIDGADQDANNNDIPVEVEYSAGILSGRLGVKACAFNNRLPGCVINDGFEIDSFEYTEYPFLQLASTGPIMNIKQAQLAKATPPPLQSMSRFDDELVDLNKKLNDIIKDIDSGQPDTRTRRVIRKYFNDDVAAVRAAVVEMRSHLPNVILAELNEANLKSDPYYGPKFSAIPQKRLEKIVRDEKTVSVAVVIQPDATMDPSGMQKVQRIYVVNTNPFPQSCETPRNKRLCGDLSDDTPRPRRVMVLFHELSHAALRTLDSNRGSCSNQSTVGKGDNKTTLPPLNNAYCWERFFE